MTNLLDTEIKKNKKMQCKARQRQNNFYVEIKNMLQSVETDTQQTATSIHGKRSEFQGRSKIIANRTKLKQFPEILKS